MCFLIGTQTEYEVATKDIPVCKVVTKLDSGVFITHWQKCIIPDTGILKSDNTNKFPWLKGQRRRHRIDANAIHSYMLSMRFPNSCNAIIPKGALYYYDERYFEYVSTELRIDLNSFRSNDNS